MKEHLPHLGEYSYVVHNGIIENYKELKDDLISKELEYRGYDSAGIALLKNDKIDVFKALGKLVNLEEKVIIS